MTDFLGLGPFAAWHAAWVLLSLASAGFLYFRPRPRVALLTLIVLFSAAYLAYYQGLARPYAVDVGSDRALVLGMAMAVADGGSPFEHVQVQFANPEPFWTYLVAALSGFSVERVPWIYDHMAVLAMGLTALGFYVAWGRAEGGEDRERARWRGVFVAAGCLGLSSMSFHLDPRISPFWHANFVFKPNHALAFGLVGLISRWRVEDRSWAALGLLQGVLMWAFILDWAYLVPAFFMAALLGSDRKTALKRAALGTAMGGLLGAPYVFHLLRDYNPVGPGQMPEVWLDHMGDRLSDPFLWSLDLGLLVPLLGGAIYFLWKKRRTEPGSLGFLLSGPLVGLCYVIGLKVGFAPEPDEGISYLRLVAGAGAGYALWHLVESRTQGPSGRFGIVFGLILAGSIPAYYNPSRDDRYYTPSLKAIAPPILATADWLRERTSVTSVIVSSKGITLAGLSGRRFLMVRPGQTGDRADREMAERDILTSLDEAVVRRAAAKYGVTHVVLDEALRHKYGDQVRGLGNRPWFEPALANSFARILVLKPG